MTVAAMQMADMKVCARRSSRVWIRRPLSRRDGRLVRAFVPDHSKSPVRSMRRSGSLAMRLMTDGGNVYRIHIDGEEADLEHELFISGIGGQGIQLMGKVLALGAIAENLFVQLTGEYGGAMRGGSTIANVVIGAERLRALPVVSEGGAALLMHDKFVDEALLPKLRPGSLIVAESSIVDHLHGVEGHELIAVPRQGDRASDRQCPVDRARHARRLLRDHRAGPGREPDHGDEAGRSLLSAPACRGERESLACGRRGGAPAGGAGDLRSGGGMRQNISNSSPAFAGEGDRPQGGGGASSVVAHSPPPCCAWSPSPFRGGTL